MKAVPNKFAVKTQFIWNDKKIVDKVLSKFFNVFVAIILIKII